MARVHSMMADADHDEVAAERFVVSLRQYLHGPNGLGDTANIVYDEIVGPEFEKREGRPPKSRHEVRRTMEDQDLYRFWSSLLRTSQEKLWENIEQCVDRQLDTLNAAHESIESPKGSLELDENFQMPRYLANVDQHIMPGSYHGEASDSEIRTGAIYDRAASVYMMHANGAQYNDGRGHSLVSHLFECYPNLKPTRILDMGCTIGQSTLVYCDYYPEAEIHAIDAAGPMLRYGHHRAETLGKTVHFSQQNAERTNFDDESFDLVVSHAVLHETSRRAMPAIIDESFRLLKPGGVMAHLEVPVRYDGSMPLADEIKTDWQTYYNGEPFWGRICETDLGEIAHKTGFADVKAGFQSASMDARSGKTGFSQSNQGVMRSWYVVSATKPETS